MSKQYVPVPISSTVTLSAEEYLKELETKMTDGISQGRNVIINATLAILNGKGDDIIVDDKAEQYIKDYVARVKEVHKKLQGVESNDPSSVPSV